MRDELMEQAIDAPSYHANLKSIKQIGIGHDEASAPQSQRYQARETRLKKSKDFTGSQPNNN